MKSSVLCEVKERREREESQAVCDSGSLSLLPGLGLQATSGQEVYQVRRNRRVGRPGGH